MKARGAVALLACAAVVVMFLPVGEGSASPLDGVAASMGQAYRVASLSETFVDTSRATPQNGTYPGSSQRVLTTLVLYPQTAGGRA